MKLECINIVSLRLECELGQPLFYLDGEKITEVKYNKIFQSHVVKSGFLKFNNELSSQWLDNGIARTHSVYTD